jgi:hypothetical protein
LSMELLPYSDYFYVALNPIIQTKHNNTK